jgi:RNA polymerase sigma factor (sigma-70 family)
MRTRQLGSWPAAPSPVDNRKHSVVERLFSEHASVLQTFFRRRVRVASDAPDLAQEVYMRMLRVSNIDVIRNPELYIFTVANNLVKEHSLRDKRQGAHDDFEDDAIQAQLAELPHIDSEMDTDARIERLYEVLDQLSPKCRAAVLMQYRDGLSYEQIGKRLGVSSNMVKKYLKQAILHCRRRMERLR